MVFDCRDDRPPWRRRIFVRWLSERAKLLRSLHFVARDFTPLGAMLFQSKHCLVRRFVEVLADGVDWFGRVAYFMCVLKVFVSRGLCGTTATTHRLSTVICWPRSLRWVSKPHSLGLRRLCHLWTFVCCRVAHTAASSLSHGCVPCAHDCPAARSCTVVCCMRSAARENVICERLCCCRTARCCVDSVSRASAFRLRSANLVLIRQQATTCIRPQGYARTHAPNCVGLSRRAWTRLNRLWTGVGRYGEIMLRWGLSTNDSCDYGAEQTADRSTSGCGLIYRPPEGIQDVIDLDTRSYLEETDLDLSGVFNGTRKKNRPYQ